MRLSWKVTVGLLVCSSWLTPSLAFAEPGPSEADKAAAEALFNQARGMMEKGEFTQACEKLRASKELDPAVGTMLYLGDCYEKANRLASAWTAFEEARVAATASADKRASIAEVRAAALKPRLSYVVVELPGEHPEGLEVRGNGSVLPADMLKVPMPVDDGPLVVVATAPGFASSEVKLEVLPGAKVPYRAILPALRSLSEPAPAPAPSSPTAAPPPSETPSEPVDDGSGQRTAAYIVGGVGVAALIADGVFTFLASSNNADSKKECSPDDPNACSVRGKSLRDDAFNQATVATVAGIVGGVALAAGVTLYVTAPGGDETGFALGYGGKF